MLYLIAVVVPPLAVLMCGKPGQAILSIPLTLMCWLPGIIHAVMIVNEQKADNRAKRYGHYH
jgi:uncharacterized membrane protein YqaE (UPF0057 family)